MSIRHSHTPRFPFTSITCPRSRIRLRLCLTTLRSLLPPTPIPFVSRRRSTTREDPTRFRGRLRVPPFEYQGWQHCAYGTVLQHLPLRQGSPSASPEGKKRLMRQGKGNHSKRRGGEMRSWRGGHAGGWGTEYSVITSSP